MASEWTVKVYFSFGRRPLILKLPSWSKVVSSILLQLSHFATILPYSKGSPLSFETDPKALNATLLATNTFSACSPSFSSRATYDESNWYSFKIAFK
jgi:hypothetical protein